MDVTADPTVGPAAARPLRRRCTAARARADAVVLNWGRRYSLWVFNFGLACCAIEFIAAVDGPARLHPARRHPVRARPAAGRPDGRLAARSPTRWRPAVKRLYEQMPEPKYVISFGACSNCGGPYWDSYCVTKGVDQIIPVDVYVPGCPPRPEALLQGILKLQEKIAARVAGPSATARRAVSPPPARAADRAGVVATARVRPRRRTRPTSWRRRGASASRRRGRYGQTTVDVPPDRWVDGR